jgi:hypothetical protein
MEHLVNFIVWALTVIGITVIVTQSSILFPLRQRLGAINNYLRTFLGCAFCFSFWAAMGVSLLFQTMTGNLFLDGCLGCGMWFYVTFGVSEQPQFPPIPTKK